MKKRRKDHSGAKKLPPMPKRELVFFHWSPSRNRESIKHYGLIPGRLTLQETNWRPPYVCFSDDPMMAWQLSGRMYPGIKSWDLWMCYADYQTSFEGWEVITDTFKDSGRSYIKEYRVYERVYKRDLDYVGSRRQ